MEITVGIVLTLIVQILLHTSYIHALRHRAIAREYEGVERIVQDTVAFSVLGVFLLVGHIATLLVLPTVLATDWLHEKLRLTFFEMFQWGDVPVYVTWPLIAGILFYMFAIYKVYVRIRKNTAIYGL